MPPIDPRELLPTVAPSTNVPDPGFRFDIHPGQFGGLIARGQEQFGEGAFRAGEHWGQIAADDVANQYTDAANKILHGDPNATITNPDGTTSPDLGYTGLKGEEALKQRADYQKKLDKLYQDARSKLWSVDQQKYFEDYTKVYRQRLAGAMGSHADQQATAYAVETNKATIKNKAQDVAAYPNDEDHFLHSTADAMNAAAKLAEAQGYKKDSPVWTEHVDNAKAAMIEARIYSIGASDAQAAMAMADHYKEDLGVHYANIVNHFEPKVQTLEGGQIGRSIIQRGGAPNGAAGSYTPEQLHGAIVGHESGGQQVDPKTGLILTSSKGALGVGQMLPATFKQYALPGEKIENKADNLAASKRAVEDYYKKYDGDWERVAVAYFSGPGNVAPVGSPTPWKVNSDDSTPTKKGQTVAQYVESVRARLGSAAAPQPAATPLEQADKELHLTPQEKHLWQHGDAMLAKGGVKNDDGTTSTISQMSFEQDGKTYNIPTIWEGADGKPARLSPDDAVKRAEAEGLDKFPSYASTKEAEDRYNGPNGMHRFLEKTLPVRPLSIEQQKARDLDTALKDPYLQAHPTAQAAAIHQISLHYETEHLLKVNNSAAFNTKLKDQYAEASTTGAIQNPIPREEFINNLGEEKGQAAYDDYQAVQQFGADKKALQTMSPDDLRAALLNAPLPEPGPGYAKAVQRRGLLQKALEAITKERQADMGRAAIDQLPAVKTAYGLVAAAKDNPAMLAPATQHFAEITLAEQSRVGIPEDQRHILPSQDAKALSQHILDSTNPRGEFDGLQKAYGQYWPTVVRDLITQGGLPPSMQAVAGLDPLNGQQLGQFLKGAEQQSKTGTIKEHPRQVAIKQLGESAITNPTDGADMLVRNKMQPLIASWNKTGGSLSAPLVDGMIDAAQNLTYAKMLAGADRQTAATQATNAFLDQFKALQMGPEPHAMVPKEFADTVANNAAIILGRMTPDLIQVPAPYGTPGNARREEYIATITSNPNWVTNKQGDGLWLRDNGGNYVNNTDGRRFELKFAMPEIAATAQEQEAIRARAPLPEDVQ